LIFCVPFGKNAARQLACCVFVYCYHNFALTDQKKLVLEKGRIASQLARDLGITSKTLYGWIAQYKDDPKLSFVGSGRLKPEVRYQFIPDNRFGFSVQRMCKVLQVYRRADTMHG
jgi:hypothetical protein